MSDQSGARAGIKDFSNNMTYESAGVAVVVIISTLSVQSSDIWEAVSEICLWISNTIISLTNDIIDSLTHIQQAVKYEQKRIASRKEYKTKKQAKQAATLAGHKTTPVHHPKGKHGPHFHPNLPKGNPHAHDHYYYSNIILDFNTCKE